MPRFTTTSTWDPLSDEGGRFKRSIFTISDQYGARASGFHKLFTGKEKWVTGRILLLVIVVYSGQTLGLE